MGGYFEVIGQKSKADKLDVKGVTQMACERKFRSWIPVSKHIRELRTILKSGS